MGLRTGAITFGGLSSGIPTNEIIEQILELERRPITALEGRRDDFQTRLEIFQDLSNKTRSLRDALRSIDNMNALNSSESAFEEFGRFKATSSNDAVISAVASPTATPGSVSLRVDQRAFGDREVSQGYAAVTDTVGTGSITITLGVTTPVVTNLTIGAGSDTVEGIVAAINDADAGVRAFVLNDGDAANPLRIVVQSETSGAEQAFTLGVSLGGGSAPVFAETQAAQDAQLTLDPDGPGGVSLTSTTNDFGDVMPGLTLSAESQSAASITIDVEQDAEAMAEGVSAIVATYNEIIEVIAEQFDVDPTTNRGGPLIGDSTLRALRGSLSSAFAQLGTGTITNAAQIGLELNREGRLQFDEEAFSQALTADSDGVRAFFTGVDSLADRLARAAATMVDPVDGLLVTRIQGTSRQIQDLEGRILDAEERLETTEANLVRQFSALESRVSEIQAQGDFLTQFLLQGTR